MPASRPVVHPSGAPSPGENAQALHGVQMEHPRGAPGTVGSFFLRVLQTFFAAAAIFAITSTSDFRDVSAFRYLIAAAISQCLWSLSLAIVDVYALLVKRSLQNPQATCIFTIGDGITGTLSFGAACASAAIFALSEDYNRCNMNDCSNFLVASAAAFISWSALAPSYMLNLWVMASRSTQTPH